MTHEPRIDTARRRIANLGNIEHTAPREPAPIPLGAAFPHFGGFPHAGANPPVGSADAGHAG